ncbi:DUF3187 family protein [Salinisphaera aquimarina]|uniref:DUF3187 family protein n=1 Tax=Salinisphaera aquimarina TaxID=2094031 RepID=A0ABV7ER18_9GAMM
MGAGRTGRVLAWLICVGLAWAGLTGAAAADDDTVPRPFSFSDQSPTVAIYGLPRAQGYTVAERGHWHAGVQVDYTSHYTAQDNAREQLLFDGETTRAALLFRRGFAHRWQASIEIPFVDHSGGIGDGFIDDFHDTFGFADGGRSRAPRDRQQFRYRRDGRLALDVSDSPSGLGDVRMGLKKRLPGIGGWGAAVAGELKLPTGDADRLTGSGGTDVALWATVGNNQNGASDWRLLAGAGGLYSGEGDVLSDQRVQGVGFGWASIGYALTPDFVVQVQANTHSAFYENTGLEALDGVAVQGALGLDWQVTERSALAFAIIEDLNTGASPDVSFTLGLQHGF